MSAVMSSPTTGPSPSTRRTTSGRRLFLESIGVVSLLMADGLRPAAQSRAASAAEYRPVLVVSVASYEKLVRDVQCFADARLIALGAHLLGHVLGAPVDSTTLAPAGLDARRPWGLVMETDGQSFPVYGFLPVTDLQRLLAGSVAAGRIQAPVRGVYELSVAGRTWYATQRGVWAVFATSRHGLATVPADPVKMLGNLHATHDLAVRVFLKNFPEEARRLAKRWLNEGPRLLLTRKPGESELVHGLRSTLATKGLDLAAALADEGDRLTLGASLDFRARTAVADLEIVVRPGTSTAESLGAPHKTQTAFGGFLMPSAALSGLWTGEIARIPLHHLLTLFDPAADQLARAGGKRSFGPLWRAVRESLVEESVDGGIAAVIRSDRFTLVVGGFVADGAKLQDRIEELARSASARPQGAAAPAWKADAAQYQGVRLHVLSLPIPNDAPDRLLLVRALGDAAEIAVGIGPRSLYVAAGKNPVQAIRQVIRDSKAKTPRKPAPVQFSLALGPLARFVGDASGGPVALQAARMADHLEQSGAKDRVRLTAQPVEHGAQARLEIEEGVLGALVSLAAPAQAAPGPRRPLPAPKR